MNNPIIYDIVDPSDIQLHNGVEMVSRSGLLKLIASSAFHHSDPTGAKKAQATLDCFLGTAHSKGFVKCDLLRTAFAANFPPSTTARRLANEAAELISLEDLKNILSGQGIRLIDEGKAQ